MIEHLLRLLAATNPGFPDYYTRLDLIKALGDLGDPRAIPALEHIVQTDTVEYDAWGVGVGLSVAEVAQTALAKIASAE